MKESSGPGSEPQGELGFEPSEQQIAALEHGLDAETPPSKHSALVRGELDLDRFRALLDAVVRRHEALRTSFTLPAGRRNPLQVVGSGGVVAFDIVDEHAGDAPDIGSLPGFDPRTGTLVRVSVRRLGPTEHLLVMSAHPAVLDSASLRMLAEELIGRPGEDDPLQYGDYAAWQADVLDGMAPSSAPTPEGHTPTRIPVAERPAAGEASAGVTLAQAAADSVAAAGLGRGGDVWLALWAALVARLTGDDRVTIALADHGRPSDEVSRTLGPFARVLPLTIAIPRGTALSGLTKTVAAERAAVERERERLGSGRVLSTFIGFRDEPLPATVRSDGLELTTTEVVDPSRGLQVQLVLGQGAPILQPELGALTPTETYRLAGQLATLAVAASADADADLWTLNILPDEERRWLLDEVAEGPGLAIGDCVHHRFEDCANAHPERVALSQGATETRYGELNSWANRIAHALFDRGVGTVGLLLERTPALIAAIFGTLKVGAAYLPLNPQHPAARIRFQLADAGAGVVLTDGANAALCEADGVEVLNVEALPHQLSDQDPPRRGDLSDVCSVIYTSGSTGQPKGVETLHSGLANYVSAMCDRYGWDGAPLRFGLLTTVSTDLGNTALFPALTTGSCLDLVPVHVAADGAALSAYLRQRPVDVVKIAPSHLRGLLASGDAAVLPAKWLIVGGEPFTQELLGQVQALGDCAIVCHYGPTETTVGSLTYLLGERADPSRGAATVPIGRPLANTVIAVVDERGALVPSGTPGELLIGGAGLARGYRNLPELTDERFLRPGPHGWPAYRTGDVVRVLPDGNVEFLGRSDTQVKIRGFRVEPGELEAALAAHPSVRAAAVVVLPDRRGDPSLVAYVVAAEDKNLSATLTDYARTTLPDFLVPAAVIALDSLPLTANGKLDRAALPSPQDVAQDGAAYVAPGTETQRQLALIWQDVLQVERVGAEDDFFRLGGHSLLAMQVVARIRAAFGVQLPLHSLFVAPRIVDLAGEIDTVLADSGSDEDMSALVAEIEALSDEEVEAMLAAEDSSSDDR